MNRKEIIVNDAIYGTMAITEPRLLFFENMSVINDIVPSKPILPFLNTYELNRLQFLKQSGLLFLSIPSATHSRFSHSIGACHLGLLAIKQIRVQRQNKISGNSGSPINQPQEWMLSVWLRSRNWEEEFLLALLLHDIGHLPLSHTFESNLEFWDCFGKGKNFKHEEMACKLILKKNKNFLKHVKTGLNNNIVDGCECVSDLIDGNPSIEKNVLCYLISGDEKYILEDDKTRQFELQFIHQLVSGLLDLDRIDHYQRDMLFSGISKGEQLLFDKLFAGMQLNYYIDDQNVSFEILFDDHNAIDQAYRLLDNKSRLTKICFENIENLAYEAMMHRAMNVYFRLDDIDSSNISKKQKASLLTGVRQLFNLTDEQVFEKFQRSNDNEILEIIYRIKNRLPFFYVGEKLLPCLKYTTRGVRKELIQRSGLTAQDVIVHPHKKFNSNVIPEDWFDLRKLKDKYNIMLLNNPKFKIYKEEQESPCNIIWVFTPKESNREKLEKVLKELN